MADVDLSEFEAAVERRGASCSLGELRQELDVDRRDRLDGALAEPSITGSAIHRVLSNWGYRIGTSTVQRHRRGDCRCRD